MRDRVLITGASGFIGYHLIQEALEHNLEVFAAVRKTSRIDHLKGLNIKFTFPDLNNVSELLDEMRNNDYNYIIHAAGLTHAASLKEYNAVNVNLTQSIAQAATFAGKDLKKMVYVSSLAAIGPLNSINGTITENTPAQPVTAYGKSKLAAEQELRTFADLNYTILRPAAVYGPREKNLLALLRQYTKGFEPYLHTDQQKLSFVYVKDFANAAVKALFNGNKGTFNISDGNFYNKYEFADVACSFLKQKTFKIHLPVSFVKIVAAITEKASTLKGKTPALTLEKLTEAAAVNWSCSIEAAKQDLGFYPRYNLQNGLYETLTWYRQNNWL